MSQRMLQKICITICSLGAASFAAFWIVAVILGGDAASGRVEDGHYYLSSHGRLTEVSRGTFLYSRVHTYSIWITHPLAIVAAIAATCMKKDEKRPRP
jgi:hypothetical protein